MNNIFFVCFRIFEFLVSSVPGLSVIDSVNKSKFCTYFLHSLHWQKSYFHAFIFDLNSLRGLALSNLVCRLAYRKGASYVTVPVLYLTVFLFSVKIPWKFLMLRVCCSDIEKENPLLVMLYRLQLRTLLPLRL